MFKTLQKDVEFSGEFSLKRREEKNDIRAFRSHYFCTILYAI